MDNKTKYNNLLQYLKGKTVALIGSGDSILEYKDGAEIDNHDVVIRINRAYPYSSFQESVGSRTDIWSFGMGARHSLRKKFDLLFSDRKFSMYLWWEHSYVRKEISSRQDHVFIPSIFSRTAAQSCSNKPLTTGSDTINFLLSGTDLKSLTIYGVDFYTTSYWFKSEDDSITEEMLETEMKQGGTHKLTDEEKFIKRIINLYSNKVIWKRSKRLKEN